MLRHRRDESIIHRADANRTHTFFHKHRQTRQCPKDIVTNPGFVIKVAALPRVADTKSTRRKLSTIHVGAVVHDAFAVH